MCLLLSGSVSARVPVEDFFKDPEFTSVSLSPTGEYITVSVPQGDRTLLAAFRTADMTLVGKWDYGARRHIDRVVWVNDTRFFMYVSLKLGRYDFRVGTPDVYASDVDGRRRADIPNGGTYRIVDVMHDDPSTVLVQRSIESAFLSRMNVQNGVVRTVATAPLDYGSFLVDHDRKVRYAIGQTKDLTNVTLRRDGDRWTEVHRAAMGESQLFPIAFDRDNKRVYVAASEAGEPAALYLLDPETNQRERVSENANVVASRMLSSSDERDQLAVIYEDGLPSIDFLNADHPESRTYAGLVNAFPDHAVSFEGISKDGRYVLVRTYSDVDPGSYYLFDRSNGQAKFLLASRDWIKPGQMSEMRPISFPTRDGTMVHGYITIPRNSSGRNLPLIMHPHGGPHGPRDYWGFNPEVQFLADRGYAVLQVNFRGSGGYGNAFERAGYKRWGTLMIDDMADAVDWVVSQGIADKDRVCSYGASYGGYAAVQSVIRYPDKYRCTIGFVGVYSLGLMYSDGSSNTPASRAFLDRVVPSAESERQAQSPINNAARIRVPVMLVHGGKDEIVPIVHYNRMKRALEDVGNPPEVTLVKPNEGHGFYDLSNQVEFYDAMEAFLDKHIGSKAATAGN
ncbi:alpha/beta hydrolase family protein [Luteimonas aestuarii]|nr:S9 family peptidase [Luteimonas aestuarii]